MYGQPFLLAGVQQDVIGHEKLNAVGNQDLWGGNTGLGEVADLLEQLGNVQRHAVADHIHRARIAGAGGEKMQREFAVVVDDGMACVGPALEPDHHVRLLGEQIRYLALSLVAPVCADDCFYHRDTSAAGIRNRRRAGGFAFSMSATL